MSSLIKRFALWGLPNASKTTFLGTLLHVFKEEATKQQPEFGFLKSYQALEKHQWPPKLDLTIEMVRFQIEHEGIPYELYLLDPPGAFLDPQATLATCPEPFEQMSLFQFYAQCDGIITLFDHRTSQGERAQIEATLGHLFQQLRTINPSAIKPHFLYALTKIHPDSNPTPTQNPPLTYLSHRVIDPQNPIFEAVDISRRPHENNTFWVFTAFERDNKIEPWTGSIFSVRDLLIYLLKPKTHPQPPESLVVTRIHGQPPSSHPIPQAMTLPPTGTHPVASVPSSHPRLAENITPPPPTLPEEKPRVFVSHNTIDAPFINPLVENLRHNGIIVWKAPESILPGEDWVDAIERGLSQSTHVVLVLSPHAVESDWVRLEMNTAIRLEREGKINIIPLYYQPCEVPLLWGNYQAINCNTLPQQILNDLMRRLGVTASA